MNTNGIPTVNGYPKLNGKSQGTLWEEEVAPQSSPDGEARQIQGSIAESEFDVKCLSLGIISFKGNFDASKVDRISLSNYQHMCRVQIKSTSQFTREGVATVHMCNGRTGKPFDPKNIDLVVVKVVPRRAWYVLPSQIVPRVTLKLGMDKRRYLEAWHLLMAGPLQTTQPQPQ